MWGHKMRIALLNHGFPPDVGGGETQAYITAATLQKHGHDVRVFTGVGGKKLAYPFKVTYLKHFKAFEKGEEGPKYFVKELKDALLKEEEFDVLYCSNFSSLQAIGYMRDIIKAKVVFTFHCVPAEEQKKVIGHFKDWELEKSFVRNVLMAAKPDITICPSGFFYTWAKEFGLKEENLRIIYNSVILENFTVTVSSGARQKFRTDNGMQKDAFVFLTPARMLPKKGLYELVRAAVKTPPETYFYIVSSRRNADQKFLKKIETFITKHGLADKIKIHYDTYSIGEMPKLYQYSDALLLPSHHEGLPVSILEAMASRKMVVCSDIPALQEIVTNNVNGLMCSAKDVSGLRKIIHKVVSMPDDERQKIIEAGYETVVQKCDADKNMKALETIFKALN
jgi:glycosyltransferase involved in cell wall biosynthesis